MHLDKLKFNAPNFSLHELTKTSFREFIEENHKIEQWQADKLETLSNTILAPIRKKFGPVIILSAYRCKPLNIAIGSSLISQHVLCEAADFEILGRRSGKPLFEVFEWIINESEIPYGQCIFELGEWIHISLGHPYRLKSRCSQALVYERDDDGKTGYRLYHKAA